jgi:6-phosphogluconolactonase
MHLEIFPSRMELARGAALRITALAADAIHSRGRFTLALSGGSTPWAMLAVLAEQEVDWARVHLFQVDERQAPDGDEQRNWTQIRRSLLDRVPIPAANLHPMPVLDPPDAGAGEYALALGRAAGMPPVLDCAQLGLGDDGPTASLVPGDPVLEVRDREVAWTGDEYRGSRRMTLTYPCLDRARALLWLVAGADKAAMVARLRAGDPTIPAGRVARARAALFADAGAAGSGSGPR